MGKNYDVEEEEEEDLCIRYVADQATCLGPITRKQIAPVCYPAPLSSLYRNEWAAIFQSVVHPLLCPWMDLTSGFFNIPMHEEDKKYPAFTTPLGLHENNRMPQGLCNSPASFMRVMTGIFGDMNFTKLLCYLDDLLVFAPTEEEALSRLEAVFQRLWENNLKLAPKKCHLLQKQVRFLGRAVKIAQK